MKFGILLLAALSVSLASEKVGYKFLKNYVGNNGGLVTYQICQEQRRVCRHLLMGFSKPCLSVFRVIVPSAPVMHRKQDKREPGMRKSVVGFVYLLQL